MRTESPGRRPDGRAFTIAQVSPVYPPDRGGTGAVAFEYTERLRRRGYSVDVFTPRYRDVHGDPEYVHRVPALIRLGNAAFAPTLYRRLDGFDLVHLHYPFFGGSEPTVLRKALTRDHVLVTSYYMDATAGGLKGRIFQWHQALFLRWVLSRSDRLLVSSLDYARHSALATIPGVLERLETHPFGVDLDRFHPGVEPELRAALRIAVDAPVLLFVGGIYPAHHLMGLHLLIDALGSIAELPWHAVIVGDGSSRPGFEGAVAARGLQSRVHFAGNVDDAALPRYYRLADVHLFPSTGAGEAFGLVAVEAAASGVPTVASNLPGVRKVVLDGETGLLAPPGDAANLRHAIATLVQDRARRTQLGRSARNRAETEFAWDPLIDRLEQTYANALAMRRHQPS
jgi:glycosyltransferase involved in cell wall biosynthesis